MTQPLAEPPARQAPPELARHLETTPALAATR